MRKEFMEPEVEVVEFQVSEGIADLNLPTEPTPEQGNEVSADPSWGW